MDKWTICVHESGHAVAAVVLDLPLTEVLVDGEWALCHIDCAKGNWDASVPSAFLENFIVYNFAAAVAELLVIGEATSGNEMDNEHAERALQELKKRNPDIDLEEVCAILNDRSRKLVDEYRNAIVKVAESLRERNKLNRIDVEYFVRNNKAVPNTNATGTRWHAPG